MNNLYYTPKKAVGVHCDYGKRNFSGLSRDNQLKIFLDYVGKSDNCINKGYTDPRSSAIFRLLPASSLYCVFLVWKEVKLIVFRSWCVVLVAKCKIPFMTRPKALVQNWSYFSRLAVALYTYNTISSRKRSLSVILMKHTFSIPDE